MLGSKVSGLFPQSFFQMFTERLLQTGQYLEDLHVETVPPLRTDSSEPAGWATVTVGDPCPGGGCGAGVASEQDSTRDPGSGGCPAGAPLLSQTAPADTSGTGGAWWHAKAAWLRGSLCRWSCPRLTLPPNSRVRRGESRARGAVRGRNCCSETESETGGRQQTEGAGEGAGPRLPFRELSLPYPATCPKRLGPPGRRGAPHPAHVWLWFTEAAPSPAPRKWIPGPQHHQVKAPDCGRQVTPRGTRVAER